MSDKMVEEYVDLMERLQGEVDDGGNVKVSLDELKGYIEGECTEAAVEGARRGSVPGLEMTETGDFISCLRAFADEIEEENDTVRILTYRELNELKRRLIEEIDEMMER